MRFLVTGGTGFIGSNLALELENQGNEVVIIDRMSTGKNENISGFKGKILKLDLSKPFSIEGNFDAIFHQAAITDPRYSNDKDLINQNIQGFKNILKLAQKGKSKLIYASSASVYGNTNIPMAEDQEKDPFTAYAKSKLEMDEMAENYFNKIHIVGLRYFNVFGSRESGKGRPASMIYHLWKQMKEGKRPRIFKWGEQKRDHIYVKDVVEANLKALLAPSGIYNVGTGIAITFNELVMILNNVLGTNLEPEYFDNPYDLYQANTQADTNKAREILKFKAKYSLFEGIKDYIKWLDEQEN